jgi:hypothetical protein
MIELGSRDVVPGEWSEEPTFLKFTDSEGFTYIAKNGAAHPNHERLGDRRVLIQR